MKSFVRTPQTPKNISKKQIKQLKKDPISQKIPASPARKQKTTNSTSKEKLKRTSTLIKQLALAQPIIDKLEGMSKEQSKLTHKKSSNIIKYLDQKDPEFTHKYKQFKSHNKNSDFEQVKKIIEQLLDKHAVERSLSISQQYILTGYLGKFIEIIKPMKATVYNSFNITRRLQTKNNVQSSHMLELPSSPRKRSPSKQRNNKLKSISVVEEKRTLLNRELARLKFLWQAYRLKCFVCPELSKLSDYSENDSHHQLAELINKLKNIERTREKMGEEKSLAQLQKVMHSFEQTIKRCLYC